MSQSLINHSPDLLNLKNDGYDVSIVSDHLVVRVPYVNANRQVKLGALVSTLDLAGDVTGRPQNHVVMFCGEYPCDKNGRELEKIRCDSDSKVISDELEISHSFSSKPSEGFQDYHAKMSTYAAIISGPAEAIDPCATSRPGQVKEAVNSDTVFKYVETASSRAGITEVSNKMEIDKVAIVGVGGTGSYILDFIAKTPVREIHVFDGDDFLQHNAFRSPGATSLEELKARPKKVNHYKNRYGLMREGIVEHPYELNVSGANELERMDFVFICVDKEKARRLIIDKVEELDIPFIDVGMGVNLSNDQLHAVVRVTTSTSDKRDHIREKRRIGLCGNDAGDVYSQNIQLVELNALNAALAVIKWKKLFGFYGDLKKEHHSLYTSDGNNIINEDC